MDKITITNKITRKDYQDFLFRKSYKHPVVIVMTITGILCLVFSILWLTGIIPRKEGSNPPFFALIFGLFCSILPLFTKRSAGKIYDSQPKLNCETNYTFSDEGIFVSATDYSASLGWRSIVKVEESAKFLLLYTSKNQAEIINKQSLAPDQIKTIKAMAFQL